MLSSVLIYDYGFAYQHYYFSKIIIYNALWQKPALHKILFLSLHAVDMLANKNFRLVIHYRRSVLLITLYYTYKS